MRTFQDLKNLTAHDFWVQGLEDVQPAYAHFDGNMYAGRLPADNLDNHDSNRIGDTMFWMFQPTTQAVEDTLVIWLNGGPGCSSFNCGVMMEHSPVTQPLHAAGYCCLQPTPALQSNPYAWTQATTMLYVEHPWGTGFSYGKPEPQTEYEASGDLYAFVQNFLHVFPDLAEHQVYIFGESYAGMFVPSILRYFHHANLNNEDNDYPKINIAGGAIGNGWMDPAIQGPATIDYSWWHGLIDKPTRDHLLSIWDDCVQQGSTPKNSMEAPFHPFTVQDDCGLMWGIIQASGHPNEYDITTFDANVDQVTFTSEGFYNTEKVKEALHAPPDHFWHGCQWGEGRRRKLAQREQRLLYMDNDKPLSMAPYISELLDAGIPLLVYNGDRDMTTNMVGTELVLNTRLDWKGKDQWLDAPRGLWKTNNYPAGWAKELDGLTFAVVYNSGHMVPYNQPGPAYDLLVRFLTQQSFIDVELPQVRNKAATTAVKDRPIEWMHPYPTGKSNFLKTFDETPSIASLEQAQVVGGSSHSSMALGPHSLPQYTAILAAFVAGLVVAAMALHFLPI